MEKKKILMLLINKDYALMLKAWMIRFSLNTDEEDLMLLQTTKAITIRCFQRPITRKRLGRPDVIKDPTHVPTTLAGT